MNKIPYPKRQSEAEIQSMLWFELKKLSLDARLEVRAVNKRICKLDVVIFLEQEAVCIIECKNWTDKYRKNRGYQKAKNTRQIRKYELNFLVPVLVCGHADDIQSVCQQAKQLYDDDVHDLALIRQSSHSPL